MQNWSKTSFYQPSTVDLVLAIGTNFSETHYAQWQKILWEKDKKKKGDHQTVVAVIVEWSFWRANCGCRWWVDVISKVGIARGMNILGWKLKNSAKK